MILKGDSFAPCSGTLQFVGFPTRKLTLWTRQGLCARGEVAGFESQFAPSCCQIALACVHFLFTMHIVSSYSLFSPPVHRTPGHWNHGCRFSKPSICTLLVSQKSCTSFEFCDEHAWKSNALSAWRCLCPWKPAPRFWHWSAFQQITSWVCNAVLLRNYSTPVWSVFLPWTFVRPVCCHKEYTITRGATRIEPRVSTTVNTGTITTWRTSTTYLGRYCESLVQNWRSWTSWFCTGSNWRCTWNRTRLHTRVGVLNLYRVTLYPRWNLCSNLKLFPRSATIGQISHQRIAKSHISLRQTALRLSNMRKKNLKKRPVHKSNSKHGSTWGTQGD